MLQVFQKERQCKLFCFGTSERSGSAFDASMACRHPEDPQPFASQRICRVFRVTPTPRAGASMELQNGAARTLAAALEAGAALLPVASSPEVPLSRARSRLRHPPRLKCAFRGQVQRPDCRLVSLHKPVQCAITGLRTRANRPVWTSAATGRPSTAKLQKLPCRSRFVQQLTALLQLCAPALERALLRVRRRHKVSGCRESRPRHEHRYQHALCSSAQVHLQTNTSTVSVKAMLWGTGVRTPIQMKLSFQLRALHSQLQGEASTTQCYVASSTAREALVFVTYCSPSIRCSGTVVASCGQLYICKYHRPSP